eukprot:TRINITY_DN70464_c0_g1_i1.p1 TRINITY_DN70464_c0_g1~~TRINITY_DN70464_c0_g1_i1.p1  ORF type:complete len:209 (-),score=57.48 TRINITY_DN70464_c0_g1_i1:101-727(-)
MKRPAETELTKEQVQAENEASSSAAASDAKDAPEEVQTVTNSADFWRVQVESVYRRRNPMKLDSVPKLLEKYAGKEITLYTKVCKTYDLDPKRFYADPKAWDDYSKDTLEEAKPEAESTGGMNSGGGVSVPNLFGSSSGGGVAVPNLFGSASGLGPVSGPLFAQSLANIGKPQAGSSSSDEEGDGAQKRKKEAPKTEPAEKPAECKTQ